MCEHVLEGIWKRYVWEVTMDSCKRDCQKVWVDEEGVSVAVWHNVMLFKILNMLKGDIFAYPLFLQKELAMAYNVEFICSDIMCKYYPHFQK